MTGARPQVRATTAVNPLGDQDNNYAAAAEEDCPQDGLQSCCDELAATPAAVETVRERQPC
jgi:hypothetical protein